MGNEQSQLTGLDISEKAVEVTDFWTLHSAIISAENDTTVSVFIGEPLVNGSLWMNHSPLEKVTRALRIYRHPCIIKYVSSWNKGSKLYLAVENIKPLSSTLGNSSTLQICIGLHSVLKALCFLHEKANVSHNNVSAAAIYVTSDGLWKLGGTEYLTKYADLCELFLEKTRNQRYEKSIDPNEKKIEFGKTNRKDAIDMYAFGVLVTEILRSKNDDEVPGLISFREFCKNGLQHADIQQRPKFGDLLQHQFFTHDFIKIYSFLTELPLKNETEKADFFTGLAEKLRAYSETIVAIQLGGLLLSRIVLLDATAQTHFIPFVLSPKEESCNTNSLSLFATTTFQQHIVPKLLQIFCVRDAQIRLLLLTHFKSYMNCFTKEQLQMNILPELLVGIKDTNDHLVSVTLHTLAELVPTLGSTIVIGGKRAKLFNDGRPMNHSSRLTMQLGRNGRRNSRLPHHGSHPAPTPGPSAESVSDINSLGENMLNLPERPSPDGGEDETSTEELEVTAEEELDNWSDWDNTDNYVTNRNNNTVVVIQEANNFNDIIESSTAVERLENIVPLVGSSNLTLASSQGVKQSVIIPDITELDIKNQKNVDVNEEFDFFQDMEPIIDTGNVFLISDLRNDNSNDAKDSDNSKNNTETVTDVKHLSLDLKFDENEIIPDCWEDDLYWADAN